MDRCGRRLCPRGVTAQPERDCGGRDEHALRLDLIATPLRQPLRRVAVTVGDRLSDPEGLWPADVALITSIPGLESVDIIATDGVLAAGYLDRVRLAFVGIEEAPAGAPASPKRAGEGGRDDGPVLVVNSRLGPRDVRLPQR